MGLRHPVPAHRKTWVTCCRAALREALQAAVSKFLARNLSKNFGLHEFLFIAFSAVNDKNRKRFYLNHFVSNFILL